MAPAVPGTASVRDGRDAGASRQRPRVVGKFLFSGDEKLYLRGVTYGPFQEDANGSQYHDEAAVERDFAAAAARGINAIRTYTIPPVWLLDVAARNGLWVMAGIPWEQHITFLDQPKTADAIEQRVREAVQRFSGHPAILGFAIGNEIPAPIVRWHGRRKVERFLERLYRAAKSEDSAALVTYVNYPSTEYLQLDFLDFFSFNVYLERQDRLEAYLARLQTLAGSLPLVMAEAGLDSRRNGTGKQAEVLEWQIRTVFAGGCAGMFVFAWTDEWARGGFEIEDWDFGLTTRERQPKAALRSVERAFAETPFRLPQEAPRISVVVCSYNGQRTIEQTIQEILKSPYPNYELIVVNDGSTDGTAKIAEAYPAVRLISVKNGGLSAARNIGMREATGEIIAYIDDDAYPDPHWLHYLADAFERTPHVAIGGPNVPPPGDGPIAECVANAPGGPIHVLLTDEIAEHIPGCNFAVRRQALMDAGGFDPIFRAAGDDVDACWRLQRAGTIGFAPAALVWHHRRNSLRAYWKQQKGYGRAEALLERKWPEKYNAAGHLAWEGRVYGPGVLRQIGQRLRVYHGSWGSAPFQALYEPAPGLVQSLAQMPEWYLVVLGLALLTAVGVLWSPLFVAAPLLVAAITLPIAQAVTSASRARFPGPPRSGFRRIGLLALTTALFVIQPLARLWGRLAWGLTPWRRKRQSPTASPFAQQRQLWSEQWRSSDDWLRAFETAVSQFAFTRSGGHFDSWDMEVRGGLAGKARVHFTVEEHGAGRQLSRWRIQPAAGKVAVAWAAVFACLSVAALVNNAVPAAGILAGAACACVWWIARDGSLATGAALAALDRVKEEIR